jgi:hypothetical protein
MRYLVNGQPPLAFPSIGFRITEVWDRRPMNTEFQANQEDAMT